MTDLVLEWACVDGRGVCAHDWTDADEAVEGKETDEIRKKLQGQIAVPFFRTITFSSYVWAFRLMPRDPMIRAMVLTKLEEGK